ncbi:FecR family protein [Pararcticibacter amylolyticus]|uniref:Anti-sigma factor n=1 Tax=Pararcticibacter amylolyticus TaxID=2173175 RepID=A0A2U2PEF0_9SPHI|nr:FecR family protein [Pararcticibacter amylolyticus]PWG79702.1 anti-sigma factor [Pararcticibacter amylolyticus]
MRRSYYTNKYLQRIARKVISGKALESEKRFLDQYYDFFESADNGMDELLENEKQLLEKEIWKRLNNTTRKTGSQSFKLYSLSRIVAAASVLIIFSAGLYFALRWPAATSFVQKTHPANHPITYGSKKAVLILSDGSKVILDGRSGGTIVRQTGVEISQASDGQIVYRAISDNAEAAAKNFNTMQTPRGGIYQIDLPDGTKVWLNSASTLRYPLAFSGNERKVELEGEAYFEVTGNRQMPFKVACKKQLVEVLGTHFNINSYEDELTGKTTLLEGSVRVNLVNTGESKILLPGQQAIVRQSELKVKNVDTENVMAWKNGLFQFDNEDIHTIMNKIARWYDVEITYESGLKTMRFGGTVSRYSDLQMVLKKLELTNTIHFKIDGRRITVMK